MATATFQLNAFQTNGFQVFNPDVALSEALALAASASANLVTSGGRTDAVSATHAQTILLTQVAAGADVLSGQSAQSVLASFTTAATGVTSALDAPSTTANFVSARAEPATAGDAPVGSMVSPQARVEVAAATTAQTPERRVFADGSEPLTVDDSQSTLLAAVGVGSEPLTAASAVSVQTDFVAARSEPLTLTTAQNGIAVMSVDWFDDTNVQDAAVGAWLGAVTVTDVDNIYETQWLAIPQKLRPTSDVSVGNWLPSSGGALYPMLDEPWPDDADYIYTQSISTAEVKLDPTALYPQTTAGHFLRYRLLAGTGSIKLELKQGATVIYTETQALTAAAQDFNTTIPVEAAALITDYTQLSVAFTSLV